METLHHPYLLLYFLCSYPTYEEWKQYPCSTVPLILPVLILPMRNGNECSKAAPHLISSGSYPTYEEWKHIFSSSSFIFPFGSYPTYEEWKLSSNQTSVYPS